MNTRFHKKWDKNAYLDYNSIALRLDALAPIIRSKSFDALVIVLRGGSFAGMHLAFQTGLPVHFVRYDRPTRTVSWVGPSPNPEAHILLCEDAAGKGNTLLDCRDFLLHQEFSVKILVVSKVPGAACTPDYCCFDWDNDDVRLLVPWNRFRINGESMAGDLPDHVYERTAWDMDGVFLDDVNPALFDEDIVSALVFRDNVLPAQNAPRPQPGDIVITSRPDCDRERTELWFKKHGFQIPVVLRDDGVERPTREQKAKWKGQRALDLGYTHFVESHPVEAIQIARQYPELRVFWWNEGKPMLIQASEPMN